MVTVKECILNIIRACNPCTVRALLREIEDQQTEFLRGTASYNQTITIAMTRALNELLAAKTIEVGFCGYEMEVVFDLYYVIEDSPKDFRVLAMRSANSIFGAAQAFHKRGGEVEKFSSQLEAQEVADGYNSAVGSAQVYYRAIHKDQTDG